MVHMESEEAQPTRSPVRAKARDREAAGPVQGRLYGLRGDCASEQVTKERLQESRASQLGQS